MWRKRGLSLNHIAETLFASETFVKAAFRLYENETESRISDPPRQRNERYQVVEKVGL